MTKDELIFLGACSIYAGARVKTLKAASKAARELYENVGGEDGGSGIPLVVARTEYDGGGFYSTSKSGNEILDELEIPRDGKPYGLLIRRAQVHGGARVATSGELKRPCSE